MLRLVLQADKPISWSADVMYAKKSLQYVFFKKQSADGAFHLDFCVEAATYVFLRVQVFETSVRFVIKHPFDIKYKCPEFQLQTEFRKQSIPSKFCLKFVHVPSAFKSLVVVDKYKNCLFQQNPKRLADSFMLSSDIAFNVNGVVLNVANPKGGLFAIQAGNKTIYFELLAVRKGQAVPAEKTSEIVQVANQGPNGYLIDLHGVQEIDTLNGNDAADSHQMEYAKKRALKHQNPAPLEQVKIQTAQQVGEAKLGHIKAQLLDASTAASSLTSQSCSAKASEIGPQGNRKADQTPLAISASKQLSEALKIGTDAEVSKLNEKQLSTIENGTSTSSKIAGRGKSRKEAKSKLCKSSSQQPIESDAEMAKSSEWTGQDGPLSVQCSTNALSRQERFSLPELNKVKPLFEKQATKAFPMFMLKAGTPSMHILKHRNRRLYTQLDTNTVDQNSGAQSQETETIVRYTGFVNTAYGQTKLTGKSINKYLALNEGVLSQKSKDIFRRHESKK